MKRLAGLVCLAIVVSGVAAVAGQGNQGNLQSRVEALEAAVAGLTDFLGERRIRDIRDAWLHMIGNVIAVLLSLFNFYLRYANGAEAGVLPWGIWISLVVVLLLLFNGWKGWNLVYKYRVGVADTPPGPPRQ